MDQSKDSEIVREMESLLGNFAVRSSTVDPFQRAFDLGLQAGLARNQHAVANWKRITMATSLAAGLLVAVTIGTLALNSIESLFPTRNNMARVSEEKIDQPKLIDTNVASDSKATPKINSDGHSPKSLTTSNNNPNLKKHNSIIGLFLESEKPALSISGLEEPIKQNPRDLKSLPQQPTFRNIMLEHFPSYQVRMQQALDSL